MEILRTAAASLPVSNQYFKASLMPTWGKGISCYTGYCFQFNILLAPTMLSAQPHCWVVKVWLRTSSSYQGHQGTHEGDYLPLTTKWDAGKERICFQILVHSAEGCLGERSTKTVAFPMCSLVPTANTSRKQSLLPKNQVSRTEVQYQVHLQSRC